MQCPCCSGLGYAECCKPYHDGTPAPTPVALMRSRYAAYALKNSEYIIRTTHPKSPYFEKDKKKWRRAILEFCEQTKFLKLEILGSGDNWVHFIAHLEPHSLEELSRFEQLDGKIYYMCKER